MSVIYILESFKELVWNIIWINLSGSKWSTVKYNRKLMYFIYLFTFLTCAVLENLPQGISDEGHLFIPTVMLERTIANWLRFPNNVCTDQMQPGSGHYSAGLIFLPHWLLGSLISKMFQILLAQKFSTLSFNPS